MLKNVFLFILIIILSCLEVEAVALVSEKTDDNAVAEKKDILQGKNSQNENYILNCVSNSTNKVQTGGNSYIFIFKDGKLYDADNKLLKKQKITDSAFTFTYKKRQDFTWEKTRFSIDRYTGRYKSYNRYHDFYTSKSKLEAGFCKQIKDKKVF